MIFFLLKLQVIKIQTTLQKSMGFNPPQKLPLNYQNLLHSINQGNTGTKTSKMPMATDKNPTVRDFRVNKVVYDKPMTCWVGDVRLLTITF